MSFNTFELLTLINLPEKSTISHASNHNKVLIVLSANEDKDLRSGLLPKIMKAVHIDLKKEAILLDKQHHGINILQLISDQSIDKVIAFGVSPTALSLNISASLYRLNKIGKVQFLFSDNLGIISTNQDRKKALWSSLQILFPN